MKDVEKITVTYTDGTEKEISRGVVFSVYDEGGMIKVSLDGVEAGQEDVVAVLSVLASCAKDLGIPEDLACKVQD